MTVEASLTYVDVPTQRVAADNAVEDAYRDVGQSDVPLAFIEALELQSAHGFLFQHHSRFAADVHSFLEEAD